MKEITLTINGEQVKGKEGETVLEICQANNIDVPTLCHINGVKDVGACRMCVVEIEKERRPVPACTYPARDGLVIQTNTDRLEKYRRLILELMFSERNHICASCVSTGDCELQNMAYRYQMESIRYPYSWPDLQMDSTHEYLVIDHNRCILCGRCIRTCDELVGVHTLDFSRRGWKEAVCADLNQPFGQSSCIQCGACFQACPTGAIFSKISAYKGKASECEEIISTCPICGVGCNISALVKDNRLVRIDSPDQAAPRGILCHIGRFGPLYQNADRVKTALKRNGKKELAYCSIEEAIDFTATKLTEINEQYGSNSIAGIVSSRLSNETLKEFMNFMRNIIGTQLIDTFDGDQYRIVAKCLSSNGDKVDFSKEASLEDILDADCIMLVGADPLTTHPVVGSYILRSISKNHIPLISVNIKDNKLDSVSSVQLKPSSNQEELVIKYIGKSLSEQALSKLTGEQASAAQLFKEIDQKQISNKGNVDIVDIDRAGELLAQAENTVIIYGSEILQQDNPDIVAWLFNLATLIGNKKTGKAKIVSLKPSGNSHGAWEMGLADASGSLINRLSKDGVKALYILAADDCTELPKLFNSLKGIEFLVAQSSYLTDITSHANVILPSPLWYEVGGNYITLDGKVKSALRLVTPPQGIKADWETLREISSRVKSRQNK